MKKKTAISFLTALLLVVNTFVSAGSIVKADTEHLKTKFFCDSGILRINEGGTDSYGHTMDDYTLGDSPWDSDLDINEVIIGFGVNNIGDYAFRNCTNMQIVSIPASLTSIGEYAFYGCTQLDNIVIPSSMATIGAHAFENCGSVSSVLFEGNTAPVIGVDAFKNVKSGCVFYVYSGLEATFKSAGIPEAQIVTYNDPDPKSTAFDNTADVSDSYFNAVDTLPAKAAEMTEIFETVQRGIEVSSDYKMTAYGKIGAAYFDAVYYDSTRYDHYTYTVNQLLKTLKDADDYYGSALGIFGEAALEAMSAVAAAGTDYVDAYYNVIYSVLANEDKNSNENARANKLNAEAIISVSGFAYASQHYTDFETGVMPITNYLISYLGALTDTYYAYYIAQLAAPMYSGYFALGSDMDKFLGASNILLYDIEDYESNQCSTLVAIATNMFGAIAENAASYDTICGTLNVFKTIIGSYDINDSSNDPKLEVLATLMSDAFKYIGEDENFADKATGYISNANEGLKTHNNSYAIEYIGDILKDSLEGIYYFPSSSNYQIALTNVFLGVKPNKTYYYYGALKGIGVSVVKLASTISSDTDFEKVHGLLTTILTRLNYISGYREYELEAIEAIGSAALNSLKIDFSQIDVVKGDVNLLLSNTAGNDYKSIATYCLADAFFNATRNNPTIHDKLVGVYNVLMSVNTNGYAYADAVGVLGAAFFNFDKFNDIDFDKLAGYVNVYLSFAANCKYDDAHNAVAYWSTYAFKSIENKVDDYADIVSMTNTFMSVLSSATTNQRGYIPAIGYYALAALAKDSSNYKSDYVAITNILFSMLNDIDDLDKYGYPLVLLGAQWLNDVSANSADAYKTVYQEKFNHAYKTLKNLTYYQVQIVTAIGSQWLGYLPLTAESDLNLYDDAFNMFVEQIQYIDENQLYAYQIISGSMLNVIKAENNDDFAFDLFPIELAEINGMSSELSSYVAELSEQFFEICSKDTTRREEYLTYNKNIYEALRIDALFHVRYDYSYTDDKCSRYWCGTYMDVCDNLGNIYPSHEGSFLGWYTDEYGSSEFDFTTRITEDLDLYSAYDTSTPPEPDKYTLTINYSYPDGTTDTYTKDYEENEQYSVASKTIEGYTANYPTVSGKMGSSDSTVEVTYTANKYKLTVKVTKPDGTVENKEYQVTYGENYNIPTEKLEGYTANYPTVSGKMGSSDSTVEVTYTANKYKLTVKVTKPDGTVEDREYEITYGEEYKIAVPEIEGYKPDKEVISGIAGAGDKEIVITYTKTGDNNSEGNNKTDENSSSNPDVIDVVDDSGKDDWSLLTLISTVSSLAAAVALSILNKKKEGPIAKTIVAIVAGVASVALFALTQNLNSTMKIVDETTLPAIGIALTHFAGLIFKKK